RHQEPDKRHGHASDDGRERRRERDTPFELAEPVWVLSRKTAADGLQLRGRLRSADAWLQPPARHQLCRIRRDRYPDLGRRDAHAAEPLARDARDYERLSVDLQRPADDRR